MNAGAAWALVAALGFGFIQTSSRKSNQLIDAYRTSFGLLVTVVVVLIVRAAVTGEIELILQAPAAAVALFTASTFFHFIGGWTLMGLSQQKIGIARTGALVSASPLVGTILAAIFLDEPFTVILLVGVLLAVVGVALISMSAGRSETGGWGSPWRGLLVATIWGISPILIRLGLAHFDHPVAGLTIGLGISVVIYAVILTVVGAWRRSPVPGRAIGWMVFGGVAGAVAVAAQWLSFDLTTIAVAITLQQLSTLTVVALTALLFREPFERMNLRFFLGTAAMLAGALLVVLT